MESMAKLIWIAVIKILFIYLSRRFLPVFIVSSIDLYFGHTFILSFLEAPDCVVMIGLSVLSVALQCAGCSVDIMGSFTMCIFLRKAVAYAASFISNAELSLSKFRTIAGTALASFLCYYFDFFLLCCLLSILCSCLLSTLPFKGGKKFWLDAERVFVEVHQLIKFTCSQYKLAFWLQQFLPHFVAIFGAIGIVIWHRLLYFNHQHSVPSAEIAILTLAFSAVLYRSLMHETKQFLSSANEARKKFQFFDRHKNQSRQFFRASIDQSIDNFVREVKCILICDYINDFWNWLDLFHIVLGMFAVFLIWIKSPNAMAVMATASFFRWWGCLFYLQVTSRLSRRSFFSHVLTLSAGF